MSLLRRLLADTRGNVLMMLGFALLPLIFSVGMGIDYSRAMRTQTKLNAAADAAALAAVTTPMMSQTTAAACTLARKMFIAQAGNLEGLVLNTSDPTQLTITIVDSNGTASCAAAGGGAAAAASFSRTVTVSYRGQSSNVFAGVLGLNTLTIHGTSQSYSAVAPNIDFYVVMDTSPSMLIAATQAGINTMVSHTSAQGGCAFACHQKSTGNGDTAGNPNNPATGAQMDNYALARSLGVVLRTDLVTDAAQNLMDVASSTSASNGATYRMAVATFDTNFNVLQAKTANLSTARTAAGTATVPTMWSNGNALSSDGNSGVANNDTNTNYTNMWNGLENFVTLPGGGTRVPGDNPQGVIFLVTDGVRDEAVSGNINNRWIGELERPTSTMPYVTAPSAADPQWCELAKNYGFRIAILYTSYLPLPSNSFYNSNVAPFQSEISRNLQSCASPGLFSEVSTDGDISAALAALFQAAVATAHLTQ